MMKYIAADDVENKTGLITLNEKAKPMVAVSDIEKAINSGYSDIVRLKHDLKALIKPQPELYGGLSVEDWGKLNNLFMINVDIKHKSNKCR